MAGERRRYDSRLRAEGAEDTRRAILDAARQVLFTESFEEFTLPRVARAAEVTTQTVRNHFGSKDGVVIALAESIGADLLQRRASAPPVDSASAATFLCEEYEEYGPAVVRLRAAAEGSAALREMATRGRDGHEHWLRTVFADRLPTDPRRRREVVDALYAATDVGTWWLLRIQLRRSGRATATVMAHLVDGAVSGSGADRP